MKTLGLIPARGGSKGIPRKNFRNFCGKPLMRWAVDVGKETCDRVLVTSDTDEAYEVAVSTQWPWRLAPMVEFRKVGDPLHTDDCRMIDVVQNALKGNSGIDTVVLLQPTQPLRIAAHVRKALALFASSDVDAIFSVVRVPEELHPDWMLPLQLLPGGHMDDMPTRRQDLQPMYVRDGTVYVTKADAIRAGTLYGDICRPFEIPVSESCNINNWDDWHRAEQMMRDRNGLPQAG